MSATDLSKLMLCTSISKSETTGLFDDDFGSNVVIFHGLHCYSSWPNFCSGLLGQIERSLNSMIEALYPNTIAGIQEGSAPTRTEETVQSWI
jgi:hypothetical protein